MIQHVYKRCLQAESLDRVLVATDDDRIREAVADFGGEAIMTGEGHRSGTDRIAEAIAGIDAGIVVNIQGDEPLIEPKVIDAAIRPLLENPDIPMGTIACPLERKELNSPDVVKVVMNANHRALYFSRSPVPYIRDEATAGLSGNPHWKHIGLYVYRREFLIQFTQYKPTPLELAEQLEQLRALEHGHVIHVEPVGYSAAAVDTEQDLERVRQHFQTTG